MARDRAFPYSEYFAQVNKRFQMPLRAMLGFIVLNLLTGLLVLGSSLAFYAIISGGGIALQISYCIPILCVVLKGRQHLPPRPHFDLGRWGYAVNIAGLLWSCVTILFYVFRKLNPSQHGPVRSGTLPMTQDLALSHALPLSLPTRV
jgi:choline transport protein